MHECQRESGLTGKAKRKKSFGQRNTMQHSMTIKEKNREKKNTHKKKKRKNQWQS